MNADVKRKQLAAALNRVAHGDRPALRLVYDMTSAKLFGACLRILNDRSEAEDVLQEVYLTVWNKAAGFDEARASPITWLVAIARNRANVDWLKALFAEAKAKDAKAVVIALQASLFEDERDFGDFSGKRVRGGSEGPYYWIAFAIRELASRYGKPVLVINGDFHDFIVDKPFRVSKSESKAP